MAKMVEEPSALPPPASSHVDTFLLRPRIAFALRVRRQTPSLWARGAKSLIGRQENEPFGRARACRDRGKLPWLLQEEREGGINPGEEPRVTSQGTR